MTKINKHIEIVSSTELELSSMSQKSRDAIRVVLAKHYTDVRICIVNNLADLEALVARRPDLVFLGMKFIPVNPVLGFQDTERIWLSQYLDENNIAYTGSNQLAHELELDKPLAKQRALDAKLDTSAFQVVRQNESLSKKDMLLTFPVFIKPTDRGGGEGVDSDSVVRNFGQIKPKLESITASIHSDSLIEEYLPGREISVAILKDEDSDQYFAMPIERIVPEDEHGVRILSPEIKHADAGLSVMVADGDIKTGVITLAKNVFRALGARDYGRIDIRLDALGKPHFLEANLIPSLIDGYGNFPKACLLNISLDFEAMTLSIVRLALGRKLDINEPSVEFKGTILPYLGTALKPA